MPAGTLHRALSLTIGMLKFLRGTVWDKF